MSNNYVVYKHTSPSGKAYVGITNHYQTRCANHKSLANSGKGYAFHAAIRKYGWSNFKHEIIEDGISKAEAYRLEAAMIKECNSLVPNGYNIMEASEGIASSQSCRDAHIAKRKPSTKCYVYDRARDKFQVSLGYLGTPLRFDSYTKESDAAERANYLMGLSDEELVAEWDKYRAGRLDRDKGYHYNTKRCRWVVHLRINGKQKFFGYYPSEQEAIDRVEEVKVEFNLRGGKKR